MSATEELRSLLDEFERDLCYAGCGAKCETYTERKELLDSVKNRYAQAIADELNSRAERTCKSTTDDNAWCFVCSECGKSFPRSQLHLAHNHGEINYCPNCGARVVDGKEDA